MPPSNIGTAPELKRIKQLGSQLAVGALAAIEAETPLLIYTIRHDTGHARIIEALLWSCWNDKQPKNLDESLACLDFRLRRAATAMIASRAYLGKDADEPLRAIIEKSGSQPPTF